MTEDTIVKVEAIDDRYDCITFASGKTGRRALSINARNSEGRLAYIVGRATPERIARLEARGYTDIEQA